MRFLLIISDIRIFLSDYLTFVKVMLILRMPITLVLIGWVTIFMIYVSNSFYSISMRWHIALNIPILRIVWDISNISNWWFLSLISVRNYWILHIDFIYFRLSCWNWWLKIIRRTDISNKLKRLNKGYLRRSIRTFLQG